LIRLFVSQITSYIVSFNFICPVQQFSFLGGETFSVLKGIPDVPQIWSDYLFHKQLSTLRVLTFYVQQFYFIQKFIVSPTFYLQQFKSFISGRGYFGSSSTREPLNLVRLIASQTTCYIVCFNFLCSAVQKNF